MKIESKLITDLKPATYNPRQISTKQFKDLKESIKKFGLVDPIIINQNGNVVVGGHQRLKICKELKHIEIDCVVLDLSKEEERELNIRLNKNSGEFDMDILANEFDIDQLVDWGFKHIDLDINIDKLDDTFELDDSEKKPIQNITFVLADKQVDFIKNKLNDIKKTEEFNYIETFGNENSNGNALYLLVSQWVEQKK
jgi:ParB-like chromosome segregation protein Spo0J